MDLPVSDVKENFKVSPFSKALANVNVFVVLASYGKSALQSFWIAEWSLPILTRLYFASI